MRYDADHKARTRERVIEEAILTIRSEGPERLGVVDVMKRAGLTHGGFYAHFESRQALLLAAIDKMFLNAGKLFERRTRDLAPVDALQAYVDFYLSAAHRDARGSCCPFPVMSGDIARMDDEVRQRFAAGLERLTLRLAELLRLTNHLSPEAAASSAFSEMIGAMSLARSVGEGAQSDSILRSAHASVCARMGLEVRA